MNRIRNTLGFLLFFISSSWLACSPSTEITGSWRSPDAASTTNKTGNILVIALTSRTNIRRTVEEDLVNALEKDGYKAIQSLTVMPPTFTDGKQPDKEELLSKIKGTGVETILTVALIDKETENRYVPGNYAYAPIPRFSYYGSFWGYYNTWYPTLYSPGYYSEDKVYFLETNLYDADSEQLLWSAQSETYNPSSLEKFSKDFAAVMLEQMEKEGILKSKENKVR